MGAVRLKDAMIGTVQMFKIVGMLCILAGCIGWGVNRIGEEHRRIEHLREMLRIIRRIQDEIGYGKHTLPEICLILAECCGPLYRAHFRQIYEQMNQKSGTDLDQIWASQIEQCQKDAPLSDEEKDILRNLLQNLGMQEEKLQAKSVGRYEELLVRNCRKTEEAYENKAKMIFSVSVLTGVFLTIMLL